jgi:D-glycero-D-manno-heptose 1,7-bisphosphate phosphatase
LAPLEPSKRAVFLDRDGVLNENRPDYVRSVEEAVILPRAPEAVKRLNEAGFFTAVVTNQSSVGRGVMTAEACEKVNTFILDEFKKRGAPLGGSYLCPHAPEAGCDCRKPRPGLLLRAAREHGLDLKRSYLVGDAVTDIEAALAAGVSPLMVRSGRGFDQEPMLREQGYSDVPVFADLWDAANFLLRKEKAG